MSITLTDIEHRIQTLIEIHLVKFLPGQAWQDRIAHRLTDAIGANVLANNLENSGPPNFILLVNPRVLAEWEKEPRLVEGLTKIFRLATSEAGLKFETAPTITLASREDIDMDDIQVRVGDEQTVAETQNARLQAASAEEDALLKTAFIIIGGTKVYTIEQMVVNLGRRLDNQVVIDDPRVSRYHAQIRYVRGKFIIFDLNSTGGTYVNGQRASQSVLYAGDVISLAGLPIIFGQDNPPPGLRPTSGDTAPLSRQSSERSTATLKTIPLNDTKNTS
ncbi:MAG: FHA domain-containing protein [Anaerolineales bacterium]|jgi:pSer/pThr/pTyr-binding forkhead associated (FHA) protein|nr:FHA domain-containing protein [Anaerolineales bacterium]